MALAARLPKMQYTRLGNSGLQVSRICLGMMSYGDKTKWHDWILNEDEAMPFLQKAVELGINFFDTADAYSSGASEVILGNAVRAFMKRDEVVVATKCFFEVGNIPGKPFANRPNGKGLSRKRLMSACDASLKRMGLDYIDLYQYHRFDYDTPIEETILATHDLIRAGKIRYWGFSTCHAYQFSKILYTCDKLGCPRPISMQSPYNLAYREEEREMIPLCLDEGVSFIPWGPMAAGFLTRPPPAAGAAPATARAGLDPHKMFYSLPEDAQVAEAVQRVAERKNLPMSQVALAWVLRKPVVAAPIIGATKMSHLEDAVAALDIVLTDEDVAELEGAYKVHTAWATARRH